MKKNRIFIAGLFCIMAAMVLSLSGCPGEEKDDDPKKIVITGLPTEANSQNTVTVHVASGTTDDTIVAAGQGTVASEKLEVSLVKVGGGDWTGSGDYYVIIGGYYITKKKVSITEATTTIPYSDFEELTTEPEE